MGLGAELKEMAAGFQAGWKMATPTREEYYDKWRREDEAGLKKKQDEAEANVGKVGALPVPRVSSDGINRQNATAGSLTGDMQKYARAIAHSESDGSGGYAALGPRITKKDGSLDQALGAYQVMESNLPSWSQAHLGRVVTRDEFLKNPELQDKIFAGEFGNSVKKYGNPQDAASVWFTGVPRRQGANRADALGTTGNRYVDKFSATLASFAEGGTVPTKEELYREMMTTPLDPEQGDVQTAPPAIPVGVDEAPIEAPIEAPTEGVLPIGPSSTVRARGVPEKVTRPSNNRRGVLPVSAADTEAVSAQGVRGEEQEYAQPAAYDPRNVADTGGVGEAIRAGLQEIGRFFGFGNDQSAIPEARPDREAKVQAFARNEGKASRAEIEEADRIIDPQGRLGQDARAVARLYGGYRYFLEKGEPEKARKYAMSMMMASRDHMQMAGALAEDSLRRGDIKTATRAIMEGHNSVPDGKTLSVTGIRGDQVGYRMTDEYGDPTDEGVASVNQLMQLATGMRNGSEWFEQMHLAEKGSMTAAQKAKERRARQDEEAANQYLGAGGGSSEFIASLNEGEKAAYERASPQLKSKMQAEWIARQRNERGERRLEESQKQSEARAERMERDRTDRLNKEDARRERLDKDGRDQQEYAAHMDSVADAQEALAEQQEKDPDDKPAMDAARQAVKDAENKAREWAADDSGRAKYATSMSRDMRKARQSTGRANAGTKEERQHAALDRAYVSAERAANREGADPQLKAQLPRVKAQVEFMKRDTGIDPEELDNIDGKLATAYGVSDVSKIDLNERLAYQDAVSGIMRGKNDISVDQAVAIAQLAVKEGKISVQDDGRVKIGTARPVYMSPEALTALATLYQRAHPKPKTAMVTNPMRKPSPDATQAEMDTADDMADRAEQRAEGFRGRQARRKADERKRLIEQLGSEYSPDMTIAQMRKAAAAKDFGNLPPLGP